MTPILINKTVAELMDTLLEPDKRRLSSQISELNTTNRLLQGSVLHGFRFGMHSFVPGKDGQFAEVGYVKGLPELHPNLEHNMNAWCKDAAMIKGDQALIRQTLFRLLAKCTTEQDARDALPECVIGLVPALANLSRTNEEAFTIKDDARAYRQYLQVVPKMEMYAAVRLFF